MASARYRIPAISEMHYLKLICGQAVLLTATVPYLFAQEPSTEPVHAGPAGGDQIMSAAAIAGAKQDPAAVARGGKVFRTYCAGCHGQAANGGPGAPDLVRSLLVLDDEKGILIAPVIREGRPDKGMPKLGLTEAQISDVVAWLHVRTYSAGHRGTYIFQNVLTGDPKKGEVYFNTTGGCKSCHSVTGDLAGIGRKYDAFSLQSRWLQPGTNRTRVRAGNGAGRPSREVARTVTVTLPDGQTISGKLEQIDDFTVGLRDSHNQFHSFSREGTGIQVTVHDPLSAHEELLHKYTDADIHNVTAYLASLK
ncbi:MAG TPA: c-type cytochrome [Bryobacteraceae bacterium]|nr:c-type cytochrome [Bryobacteraceae bacterium]